MNENEVIKDDFLNSIVNPDYEKVSNLWLTAAVTVFGAAIVHDYVDSIMLYIAAVALLCLSWYAHIKSRKVE